MMMVWTTFFISYNYFLNITIIIIVLMIIVFVTKKTCTIYTRPSRLDMPFHMMMIVVCKLSV